METFNSFHYIYELSSPTGSTYTLVKALIRAV